MYVKVSETVFDTINHEYDKSELSKRAKQKKAKFGKDEKDSDCILHGYIKKLVRFMIKYLQGFRCHIHLSVFRVVLLTLPGKIATQNFTQTG